MAISNMRAFTNNVKKQLHINYNVLPSEATNFMVDNLADTIEFVQGNHAILTDHVYNMFPSEHGVDKARNVATSLLNNY